MSSDVHAQACGMHALRSLSPFPTRSDHILHPILPSPWLLAIHGRSSNLHWREIFQWWRVAFMRHHWQTFNLLITALYCCFYSCFFMLLGFLFSSLGNYCFWTCIGYSLNCSPNFELLQRFYNTISGCWFQVGCRLVCPNLLSFSFSNHFVRPFDKTKSFVWPIS